MLPRFFTHQADGQPRQRGQIILILALAMVGLLVAAGLAVDTGVLLMRKAQLDRAVDAAALSGVVRLAETNTLNTANTRGMQLLAANRIVTSNPVDCASVNWTVNDYCGARRQGSIPGAIGYHVEVRWQSETFFMPLVGFSTIPLRSAATAEYMPMMDIFASDSSEAGLVRTANQAIFGPSSCASMGDAYTPTCSPWHSELEGVYTYRIRIPASYLATYNQVRVELFDPDTSSPANAGTYTIYDLDGNSYNGTCSDTNRWQPCLISIVNAMPANPADKRDTQAEFNPVWFVRIDENRTPVTNVGSCSGCGSPGSYTPAYNTRTLYRLYYLERRPDGTLQEVDLAYYIGKNDDPGQPGGAAAVAEAQATDMHWVSPGAPAAERMNSFTYRDVFGGAASTNVFSVAEPATTVEGCDAYRTANPTHTNASRCEGDGNFIIDLTSETPSIMVDPGSGVRDLYLDVRGLTGSSENGFEFWAGPPKSANPALYEVPSNINARQNYIVRQRSAGNTGVHSSYGVGVYGIGYLPMNSNIGSPVTVPLTYVSTDYGDQTLNVSTYDSDSGATPPIAFFFDTIPTIDWAACYANAQNDCNLAAIGTTRDDYVGPAGFGNNVWGSYSFKVPSELDIGNPIPFYGGRLTAYYRAGYSDTFVWRILVEGRPFLTE